MQVKKHLKNGKNVSMGFGFIEFDSLETATNVCRDLQVKPESSQNYLHKMCNFGNSLQLNIYHFPGNCFGWALSYFATLSCQER